LWQIRAQQHDEARRGEHQPGPNGDEAYFHVKYTCGIQSARLES